MSNYVPKPGSFSLFKNDRKEKDTHPDYRGDGALLDGTPARISAWLKEANGKKFFSISIQPKEQQQGRDAGGGGGSDRRREDTVSGRGSRDPEPFDDFIPFASSDSII